MSKINTLPKTPKELFNFPLLERLTIDLVMTFFRVTGLWKYNRKADGDIETMTFSDKVYWLYKTTRPVRFPRKGSGLKKYFENQKFYQPHYPEEFLPKSEMTLSAVGDLINHAYLHQSEDCLYEQVADLIFSSDVKMANLECPVIEKSDEGFVFSFTKAPPLFYDPKGFKIVKGFQGRQYDFMATACNHSLDFGMEGVETTLKALDQCGIQSNGVNRTEADANRATIIQKKDIKLGVIAYTFGLNAHKPPADRPRVVNLLPLNDRPETTDFSQLKSQIQYCKDQGVDFIIAHLHWGLEHEFYPMPEQVEVAHYLAEMGIDTIIGHHPHVLQPVEYYTTRRDPYRVVPIYYSLGNLVNAFSAPYLCVSGLARMTLTKGQLKDGTQRVYVKDANLVKINQVADSKSGTIHLESEATSFSKTRSASVARPMKAESRV